MSPDCNSFTPSLAAPTGRNTTMTDRFPAIRVTMLPRDTNAHGTIFGGVILSYIDLAGGIECRRQSPKKFVTKAMHEVVFVAPVYLGDLVTFYTRTLRVGQTQAVQAVHVIVDTEADSMILSAHHFQKILENLGTWISTSR